MTNLLVLKILIIFTSHLHWRLTVGTCATSIQGVVFREHVYYSIVTTDIQACYYSCRSDERCQSLNFFANSRVCQFNNRTNAASPGNFVQEKDAFYFDNPFRVPLGSSKRVPAISCHEIRRSSSELKSGIYWLHFRGWRNPMNVYCNMKTGAISSGCHQIVCNNGGTCIYQEGGLPKCLCKDGFNGDHCDDEVDACMVYKNLTEADRNQNYTRKSSGYPACDTGYLATGWYRFTGKAGNMMATECVPKYHCNTHAPGWISGHPTAQEGVVTRQVCFHWSRKCCHFQVQVRVKNCGVYYVYYFVRKRICSLRYYGKWEQ